MSGAVNFQYKHLTASGVVTGTGAAGSTGADNTGKQAILHSVTINSGAAASTCQIFDYNSTTSPQNAVTGAITGPTGGFSLPVSLIFDTQMSTGITVVLSGTIDVTVAYR